jgi:DNA invertase Pin-like site-specific DNA recombinase
VRKGLSGEGFRGALGSPELHRLLDHLRKGDVLVVWKLDRLSRSLKDLLLILEKIKGAGADFQSLTEAIDTSTPAGRMMMQIVGSFAEFERAMLRERTRTGLDAARQEGRVGGRRPKLPPAAKGSDRPGAVRPQDRAPTPPGCFGYILPPWLGRLSIGRQRL